jgi:hypothetical protein
VWIVSTYVMMIKFNQMLQSSEEDCTCLPACLAVNVMITIDNLNILSVLYH